MFHSSLCQSISVIIPAALPPFCDREFKRQTVNHSLFHAGDAKLHAKLHASKCAVCSFIIGLSFFACFEAQHYERIMIYSVWYTIPVENQGIMAFQTNRQSCKWCPWSCLSLFAVPIGKWCLAWWCFGGAGQLAVMTWCFPPSSFFCCTASGESKVLSRYFFFLFLFLHIYIYIWFLINQCITGFRP